MIGHDHSFAAGEQAGAPRFGKGSRHGRRLLIVLIPLVVLGFSAAAAGNPQWTPPDLPDPTDEAPDGRAIVQRAIDFIDGHTELAFEALATYEAVQDDGQKLQFEMLQRVARRRPDQLFWMTLFDDASVHSAWCSGGKFTLLKQPDNIWARVDVPPTIAAAVSKMSEEYGIDVPFVDLLSGNAAELWLGEDVESVEWVGTAWIEGWWTDHIAIRKPGIDFELWFRQSDEPFLMKMALVVTDEIPRPGHTARFRHWSAEIPDNAIPKFEPPSGSEPVELIPDGGI